MHCVDFFISYTAEMASEFLKRFGLNGVRLAKLTGQTPNTISRKIRRDQGLELGAREAGVLACLSVMDDEQRAKVEEAFKAIMEEITD